MSDSTPARLWRRIAAGAYDLLLQLALVMAAAVPAVWLMEGEAVPAGHLGFQLYLAAVVAAFHLASWSRGGQTLGMRAWRLRVEGEGGEPLTAGRALLRWPLACLGWLLLAIGPLWCLVDREGRALQDRLSGTRVVVLPG